VRLGVLLITIFVELRVVAGGSRKWAGSPQAVSRRWFCAVALRKRRGQSMAWARHGHGMASVNQTRPHCVNQMGKTHSKLLAALHGMGTACYVWIGLYLYVTMSAHFWSVISSRKLMSGEYYITKDSRFVSETVTIWTISSLTNFTVSPCIPIHCV
jgi:hypothetical protein